MERLPLTLLEIHVLTQVGCTTFIFCFWWSKPRRQTASYPHPRHRNTDHPYNANCPTFDERRAEETPTHGPEKSNQLIETSYTPPPGDQPAGTPLSILESAGRAFYNGRLSFHPRRRYRIISLKRSPYKCHYYRFWRSQHALVRLALARRAFFERQVISPYHQLRDLHRLKAANHQRPSTRF